ncbi:DNase I-like protein [Durotheca rogersii]|uniref:DNase I-like protein n=1 Tax=Durotheca rogersii TaxID=419775 RepID=UPI00221EEFCE|nr:DNase I-like protein [Durotheca rogersii]KAI5861826.1 DNase I-like protein [Durotheca rogersii]
MDELPTELNFITLNCWGLRHLSQRRSERLTAIGRQLAAAEPTPHIVALQEVWTQEDYRSIRRETRLVLPFGKYYHSGTLFGGGLAILSRWPIEESTMFRYPLNGRPTAFFRGDWFVGKGVACARIRYGPAEKDVVEVFNTHTHAEYEHPPRRSDSYLVHRIAQNWEMAKLVRGAAERGHLAVALGDFNNVPLSLSYRMLTAHAPVRDVWRVINPDSSLGDVDAELERARRRPIPGAAFNVAENGVTSDSVYNTWAWSGADQRALRSGKRSILVPPDTPDPCGKRIDYIFFSPQVTTTVEPPPATAAPAGPDNRASGGQGPRDKNPNGSAEAGTSRRFSGEYCTRGWVVKDARVGMLARHPELGCSLSDHFSVEATLRLHTYRSATPSLSSRPPSLVSLRRPARPDGAAAAASGARPSDDHAASLLALEGTYLESPTTSEFRASPGGRGGRLPGDDDLGASFDDQLRDCALGTASHSSTAFLFPPATAASDADPRQSHHSAPPHHHNHHHHNHHNRYRGDGLPRAVYDEVLGLVHAYAARERRQRRLRAAHFAAWAVVLVACCAAVWPASARAPSSGGLVAFLLLLLAGLGFAVGALDGLTALLFFGGELRALDEFEWEIMNAKATLAAADGAAAATATTTTGAHHSDDTTEGGDYEKGW